MTSISYNLGIPASGNNPSTDQPNMKTNNDNIATYVAVDHVGFNASAGATSGHHLQVTFDSNNVPTPPVAPPVLFTNTVAALPQLFFYSGDATHSSTQYVNGTTGSTFLLGGMILKWGQVPAVSNGGTVNFTSAFPNNCYSVVVTLNIASTVSPVGINGFTASGFTFRTTAAGNVPITYIAIGN